MAKTYVTELTAIEIEDLYRHIRVALGISLAISDKAGRDQNDAYAALGISDNLHDAVRILEGTPEAHHG